MAKTTYDYTREQYRVPTEDLSLSEEASAFRESEILETFEPYFKSRQAGDHPVVDHEDVYPEDRRSDGENIYRTFGLEPLPKWLAKAAYHGHAVAEYPKALAHFLTHIKKWEKWETGEDEPYFGDQDLPRRRVELLEWYGAMEDTWDYWPDDEVRTQEERDEIKGNRRKRLRPGGTGIILHGEQGTTKTTAMYWLIANIMEVNQRENVIWQSTLDDTEWQVFAPWTTVCLPEGVEVKATVNPHSREYRDVDAFEVPISDLCRQVIYYDGYRDLVSEMADRWAGHFYAVYPDPRFRGQEALTGWAYDSVWDVDHIEDATDLNHNWFALMEAIQSSSEYNYWTTLVGDEAHKWLSQGVGNDEHDAWNKIKDWATYWGDARKNRLSVILAVHKWLEIHSRVRDKVRWGATMNGEEFPNPAPLTGMNRADQDLGDMVVWSTLDYNHVGYPDMKRKMSVDADISVEYPGFEREKQAKT